MKLFEKLQLSARWSLLSAALLCSFAVSAQTEAERLEIVKSYDAAKSEAFQREMKAKYDKQYSEMLQYAQRNNIPLKKRKADGTTMELQRIASDGTPIYYALSNLGCAKTTRAIDLNTGGSLGLNVNGQNMTVHVWDGGPLRTTHTGFGGRATVGDGVNFTTSNSNNGHANHVAGTMAASLNANGGSARGMAYQAAIKGFDWNNDVAEATTAAANGMLVSNHSYGYGVTDANCVMQMGVHWIGKYDQTAADWDAIMANYPYYQQVNAAGNDRECQASITNKGGYDLLAGHSCAKNAIVVAAVNEVASYTSPSSVVMSTFSNWGPTDDGRIKPDISAKGVNVKSIYSTSNTSYATLSGTSMASPNATGTLALIQQHYKNVKGSFMYASMLRGLVLHTADEAGTSAGPDYRFGWGLLNAKAAAQAITASAATTPTAILSSQVLSNGSSYTITVSAAGGQNLEATICWTDPAGTPLANSTIDPTTRALRNDLDIRISRGTTTYLPWILNPASPAAAATKGDNIRDNIEKIQVAAATAGVYTITVTHKGTLVGSNQRFALIVTGIGGTPPPPAPTYCTASGTATATWIANVACAATSFANPSTQLQSNRGYTNYTTTTRSLRTGANSLVLTPGFSSTAATRYWAVWVDFNNDNDFADAGEQILNFTAGSTAATTQTVTIPLSASGTTRRMRVLMSASPTMAACGVFATGEVEDYMVSFTTPPPVTISTCASNGTNASYEWIAGVSTNAFNNTSTAAQSSTGYTNYISQTVGMYLGTNTIRLTPGFASTTYTERWGVWIDFNNDNDFNDAGEQILNFTTGSTGVVTTTVSIPSTAATNSPRRMRIVMSDAATVSPCGTYNYGETEDYMVTFTRPPSTGPAPAPTTYCAANGNSIVDEWIDLVQFGGMSNVTGANGGYGNFTNRIGTLARGTTSAFRYSAGFTATAYTEYWAVFIDFNRDGDFTDAGEQVVNTSSSSSATLSTNVTIPATASVGLTRVRVVMRYKTAPAPCGSFDYGEVEDYLLNITDPNAALSLRADFGDRDNNGDVEWLENGTTDMLTPDVVLFPNPTSSDITVDFDRFQEPKDYQIYTTDGKVVAIGRIDESRSKISTSQLPAGAYFIRFTDRFNTHTQMMIKQ
jgi:trimeric autotransporter adhesin